MPRELASPLAPAICAYVAARRAEGNAFVHGEQVLGRLDRLACEIGWGSEALGRELVEAFAAPRPGEAPPTTGERRSAVRGLGAWMLRRGLDAYVLPRCPAPRWSPQPVVLTTEQVRSLLAAADRMERRPQSPLRHVVFPALLRTMYACGLRVGEARLLTVGDLDAASRVITIRDEVAKFSKGRRVPCSDALAERLVAYADRMGPRGPSAPLFPSPAGFYTRQTIAQLFRALVDAAGIPRTEDGPTPHSLRHSFACHRIMLWAREGADADALLPLLSSYLGHEGVEGTERYLRMTAEAMPDLRELVERECAWVIPGGGR